MSESLRSLAINLGLALALALAGGVVPVAAEKEAPPRGGEPKDFVVPEKRLVELDNGLVATLVPYGNLPKVTVSVRVRSGNIDETADQVWLADLTGTYFAEGTTTHDAEALAAAFAAMGGELSVTVTLDATYLTTDVLSEYAVDAVHLLAEVVRNPAFPASEEQRLQDDLVRQLDISLSQPQSQAEQKYLALLYPDHPYGRLFPTEEMIRNYSAEEVRRHWQSNFGAQRTRVYVAGLFETEATDAAIREAFGDWEAGPPHKNDPPEMHTKHEIHLIDRPGAVQSTLRVGLPVPDPSHEDYLALEVTDTLLGGFFSSRITSNIRENKGYTYTPYSAVSDRYRAAHWTQNADVTTEVTGAALDEIFMEIDRLGSEPPSQEELAGVQNYLAGVFVLQNSSRGGIIGQLWFLDVHGLGDEFLSDYVRSVYAVTPEKISEMASTYLRAPEMTLVVVGDREKVTSQLEGFGPVLTD